MSSPIKTEGITLRVAPFSETSRVVTWLTPDAGRLVTLARGACRPRSPLLGQFDLYYTCELICQARTRDAAYILIDCFPVRLRTVFRTAWQSAFLAAYFCDLAASVSTENTPHPALYRILSDALDALQTRPPDPLLLCWFELRVLGDLGLTPILSPCATCAAPLAPDEDAVLSAARGGFLCRHCRTGNTSAEVVVPAAAASLLRTLQKAPRPTAIPDGCPGTDPVAALRALSTFLDYHLDTIPPARGMVMRYVFNPS